MDRFIVELEPGKKNAHISINGKSIDEIRKLAEVYSRDSPDGVCRRVYYCPMLEGGNPPEWAKDDIAERNHLGDNYSMLEQSAIPESMVSVKSIYRATNYAPIQSTPGFNLYSSELMDGYHAPLFDIDYDNSVVSESELASGLSSIISSSKIAESKQIRADQIKLIKSASHWHGYMSRRFSWKDALGLARLLATDGIVDSDNVEWCAIQEAFFLRSPDNKKNY